MGTKTLTYWNKKTFIGLCSLLVFLNPALAHAESAAAASGKALEQSYLKARQMGENATTTKIYAATQPLHDRALSLENKERENLFRRFARRSNSFFRSFASETKNETKTDGAPLKVAAPAQQSSTGTVTGSAGAKDVNFGSGNQKNENPAVSPDGIVLDR